LEEGSARLKDATYTGQHKQRRTCRQTPMARIGFEPTIPVFEQKKIYRSLHHAATVMGLETQKHVLI
jgi:hypothetical protein